MNFYHKIIHFIEPTDSYGTKISHGDKTHILFNFSMLLCGLLLTYATYTIAVLKYLQLAQIEYFLAILAFCCPFILKFTKSYLLASNVLIVVGLITGTTVSLFTGGVEGPVIFWLALCPLCSGMLLGKRGVFFWGTFTFGIAVLFGVFNENVQVFEGLITDKRILKSLRYRAVFGTILFSSLFTYFYQRIVDKSIGKIINQKYQLGNLLRVVGHDISNPIVLILGICKRVLRRNPEDKNLNKILRAGVTIKEIIEQVRGMQALESGKSNINLGPVSVLDTFEKGGFVFSDALEKKNLNLVYMNDKKDFHVQAESVTFSNQVFNNLLSNAIKFSPKGGNIEVSCEELDESLVKLSVKDYGIGIPEEVERNLFKLSSKTSRFGTDGESGTGFGMPLVKFYVDLYEGEIEVDSYPAEKYPDSHGTTFSLLMKKAA